VIPWYLAGGLAAGASLLFGRRALRRKQQEAAAAAAGLAPAPDLTHLPVALQRTALWTLSDGGFERRVLHGVVPRAGGADVEVTAFDLETLRERRGEWAYLPVEPPFRIAGVVSVVVCEIDRSFPHVLFKRAGESDALADDRPLDRVTHLAKGFRDGLGLPRSYPAELPDALPPAPIVAPLPPQWRAYSRAPDRVVQLATSALHGALEQAGRRDLVIELLDALVVIYPATHDAVGPDALADLTATALQLVDGLRGVSISPRGVEA
jgi:hypothetical protein